MMIGDKKTFGVELKVVRPGGSDYKFAKCFFWIFDDCLGNPDEVSHLGLLASSFEDLFERFSSQRSGDIEALFGCDTEEIFQFFESQLWAGSAYVNKNKFQVQDPYNYFSLPVGVEIFDGDRVYLLRGSNSDRVIWKKWGEKLSRSKFIPKGHFGEVIKNVVNSLKNKGNVFI